MSTYIVSIDGVAEMILASRGAEAIIAIDRDGSALQIERAVQHWVTPTGSPLRTQWLREFGFGQ